MPEAHLHRSEPPSNRELALLAHEVRGALTVVSGLSELLRRDLQQPERQAALDGIARAIRRIDRLMQQALDGTLEVGAPRERIDLAELAGRIVEEQRSVTGRAIELWAADSPVVLGAPEALERALGNLIDNALKYSLATSPVEVTVACENDLAVMAVADRGPGVPASMHERVFEPFERISHDETPGSGLGLTVVKSVAEDHGGSVDVRDRAQGGAVFRIELPLAP